MRHEEGVVPSVSFVKSGRGLKVFALFGIEGREEATVRRTGAQGAKLGGVVVLVAQRAAAIAAGIVFLAEGFGKTCERGIGHVVFESVGD